MPYLEVSKEVKEALDVIKSTPYPLYSLLNWANPEFDAGSIKSALNVLREWDIQGIVKKDDERLALRYILGEDTVKLAPKTIDLSKGTTITLDTGQVITLAEDLTVKINIKG